MSQALSEPPAISLPDTLDIFSSYRIIYTLQTNIRNECKNVQETGLKYLLKVNPSLSSKYDWSLVRFAEGPESSADRVNGLLCSLLDPSSSDIEVLSIA